MRRGFAADRRGRRGLRHRRDLHRDRRRPAAQLPTSASTCPGRNSHATSTGSARCSSTADARRGRTLRIARSGSERIPGSRRRAIRQARGTRARAWTRLARSDFRGSALRTATTASVTSRPIMRSDRTGAMSAQPMMPSSRPAESTHQDAAHRLGPEHLADVAQGILGSDGHDPRRHDLAHGAVHQVGVIGQRQRDIPVGQDGDRLAFLEDRCGPAIGVAEDHDRLEHGAERRARQRRGRHHVGGGQRFQLLLSLAPPMIIGLLILAAIVRSPAASIATASPMTGRKSLGLLVAPASSDSPKIAHAMPRRAGAPILELRHRICTIDT